MRFDDLRRISERFGMLFIQELLPYRTISKNFTLRIQEKTEISILLTHIGLETQLFIELPLIFVLRLTHIP